MHINNHNIVKVHLKKLFSSESYLTKYLWVYGSLCQAVHLNVPSWRVKGCSSEGWPSSKLHWFAKQPWLVIVIVFVHAQAKPSKGVMGFNSKAHRLTNLNNAAKPANPQKAPKFESHITQHIIHWSWVSWPYWIKGETRHWNYSAVPGEIQTP